jgi:carboxyl-terminal processing protease
MNDFRKRISGDLYTNLTRGDVTFAFIAYNRLLEKIKVRDQHAKEQISKGFDFSENEDFMFDRADAEWASTETDLDLVWKKKLKNDILTFRMMDKILLADTAASSDTLKAKDIARHQSKLTPEERTLKRLKTYKIYLEENEPIEVLEIYLSSLARLYDPHSSYMSPKTEDDFNVQMQLSFVGIGALLSSEDGYVKVEKIIPGGPAEKSGVLNATDKIIAIGEEGSVPIDIVDMPINKVVDKIRGAKGTKVYLTILPGSEGGMAVPKVVSIMRDTVELKESEASSDIREIKDLTGRIRRIGIIKLPSFYLDFQGAYNERKTTRVQPKMLRKFSKGSRMIRLTE